MKLFAKTRSVVKNKPEAKVLLILNLYIILIIFKLNALFMNSKLKMFNKLNEAPLSGRLLGAFRSSMRNGGDSRC